MRRPRPKADTYHAVPFDWIEGGDLVPGEAKEAPSWDAARRRAEAMAGKHAGALMDTGRLKE